MRFADGFRSTEDTIERHREVIEKKGAVWVGKLGRPVGTKITGPITTQVDDGEPSYLFLVQRVGTQYDAFRGRIVSVAREVPEGEEGLVPKYYKDSGFLDEVTFWVKISSLAKVKAGGLSEYRVASSGRPLLSTLRSSMAPAFAIKYGRGVDY